MLHKQYYNFIVVILLIDLLTIFMELQFDENTGLLLPGEHELTFEEFENEFVYNDRRKYIYGKFNGLIEIFKTIECSHIYIDGSYVTSKPVPNDIDVCWHMAEEKDKRNFQLQTLFDHFPFLFNLQDINNRKHNQREFCADVFPANSVEGGSKLMFKDFFQRDKETNHPKGIIIVNLS